MDMRVWSEVVRAALADKQGQAIIQGSPRGFNHLHELFVQAQETENWQAFHYSTVSGGLVSPEEIEAVRATVAPNVYAQEFEADFAQSVSAVYLMFSRQGNVREDLRDLG